MINDIEIRLAKLEDIAFIYSTWLRSYRHSAHFTKKISNEIYYDMHHKIIDRFISRGGEILVACPKGEPDVILGYVALETSTPIVQYIYVKKNFRRMGIGAALFKAAGNPKTFTHWTTDTDWIIKKIESLTYNPYLV